MRPTIYATAIVCCLALGCEVAGTTCPCEDIDLDALTEIVDDTGCPCPGDLVWCDGTCVDVMADDPANCGACGRECSPYDQHCDGGECACNADTYTNCGGTCVHLGADVLNCGACGNECGPGAPDCTDGVCTCDGGAPCTVCDTVDDCEALDASGGTVPTCGWCIGGECQTVQWDGVCGPDGETCGDGTECVHVLSGERCEFICSD